MEEETIKIKIKSIDNQECEFSVKKNTTAEELKTMIAEKKNVGINDIRLIYQGQCLSNTKTIAEYNIQNDHIIHAVIRKKENINNNAYENKNEKTSQFKNTDQDNNTNNYTSSSNPLNDPLQYGFASNINFNNLNSNANTTDNNRPFGSTSIPTPNIGGATPLYFTHMRLTRNDNLENDIMGQTNMCSLLNDIMSQVNINPNFIYGAATAAVNSVGSGENFFTANLRPTDTNVNMNDFRTNKEKEGTSANNSSKQKDMEKDEARKENENVSNDAEKSVEKGTNNDNCENANPEHNKQKNERPINNKHSSEGKHKGKKSNSSSSSGNSSRSNSSYESNKNDKESDEDEDKKKLKKKLKKKYMQKIRNKYDENSLNKENNDDDIYSSSYNSNYESSCSENSDTKEREIDEEKKKRYKNKIIEKMRKKREKKEKKKKKKYYYSSNSSSDYDKIYERDEKKKKKKLRNKGKFMFDPNLLYNPNYMRNMYRGAYNPGYPNPYINNFNNGNAFRPNTNFNNVFNNNSMLRNGPYPYMKGNDMNRPMYYYDQKCANISENENYINFKDDISDGYENIKKGLNKDFFKSSFKREELNVNDKKRMINTMNINKNISDANNNNSETLFGSNFCNNNVHTGNRTMNDTQNLIKNANDCYTGGILDSTGLQNSNNTTTNNNTNNRNSYANIIPFNDVELVRNNSPRTNSRGTLNQGEDDLSENNLMPEHMRSIQMASNNRRHLRSTSKLLNEESDFEYKNIELNIPWRIMDQLLVLLEEETGYKRPNLSSYINSYYNTNSIYVFFNLFVHINNIINSIIIQFNHSNFLNNDISMSSFSRISIILSLASVIFSRLSNFFFVFYDNFYCNNYGRSYRYSEPINHEYLRELRNFYYSNNRNNNMRNSNIANLNSEQNNTYDNFRTNPNRTNLQQEFEDYYKNYLSGIDVGINNNLLLRRDHTNFKTENLTDNIFSKDDYINHKFKNKHKLSNSFMDPKENKYNNHKFTDLKGSLRANRDWNTNNPFSTLQNYNKNNDPLLYISKNKKKGNKKNGENQKKNDKDTNSASANKNPSVCSSKNSRSNSSKAGSDKIDSNKKESENKNIVESNVVDSRTKNPKDKGNFMINIFKNLLKNEPEQKTPENNTNEQNCLKNNEKKDNNCPNTALVCYDNNMDDMYGTSDDEKEQKDSPNNNEPNKMDQQNSTNTPLPTEQNEKRENDGKPNDEKNNSVGTQKNEQAIANNVSIPNINFANILNDVQNQLATHKAPEAPQRDKFDGVPDKVKERYANWTENAQIFSGQMIKICRNKRPLSYTYLGESSLNEDISYNNPLPFLWKKNMSNINASFDLEVSDELMEAFDMHILEFVKKSIKNNEDYKSEKSKYPSLSKCEELFDEADKN